MWFQNEYTVIDPRLHRPIAKQYVVDSIETNCYPNLSDIHSTTVGSLAKACQ